MQQIECIDFFEIINAEDGQVKIKVIPFQLQAYCAGCLGFYNYVDYSGKYNLVQVTDGCIVNEASIQDLKHAIKQDLQDRGINPKVWEVMAAKNFLSEHCMHLLPKLKEVNFHPCEPNSAFFYYRNGVVKVNTDTTEILSYSDFHAQHNCYLWKAQICKRDFIALEGGLTDVQFYRFLSCICNHDADRLDSLLTIIGYLLHPYKDPANTKAVILVDEEADFSGEAHGGTGKSLIGRAIQQIVSTVWRDAKNYNGRETFASDDIKPHTKVIVYDDVKQSFDFEELYAMITGDMQVKRKFKDSVTILFEHSPKILISSNSIVKGTGGSADERRRIDFEVASYFTLNHTPIDEFGNRFFSEWNGDEWRRFDALMIHCVQLFIINGLIRPASISLVENRLKLATHPEFVVFMDAKISEATRFDKAQLLTEFQRLVPSTRYLSGIAFKGWIDKWTNARGYGANHFKSNGMAIVQIDVSSNSGANDDTENNQTDENDGVEER